MRIVQKNFQDNVMWLHFLVPKIDECFLHSFIAALSKAGFRYRKSSAAILKGDKQIPIKEGNKFLEVDNIKSLLFNYVLIAKRDVFFTLDIKQNSLVCSVEIVIGEKCLANQKSGFSLVINYNQFSDNRKSQINLLKKAIVTFYDSLGLGEFEVVSTTGGYACSHSGNKALMSELSLIDNDFNIYQQENQESPLNERRAVLAENGRQIPLTITEPEDRNTRVYCVIARNKQVFGKGKDYISALRELNKKFKNRIMACGTCYFFNFSGLSYDFSEGSKGYCHYYMQLRQQELEKLSHKSSKNWREPLTSPKLEEYTRKSRVNILNLCDHFKRK